MAVDDQITLTLEGDRARDGVALAAFDSFVSHFLLALRYHYRSSRATRATIVRRSGRPLGDEDLATGFRLVAFRRGSGVAVLEPLLPTDEEGESLTEQLPPTLAWDNLVALLNGIDREDRIDPSVTEELRAALKALGHKGTLSVEVAVDGSMRRHELDEERLTRLRSKWEEAVNVDTEQTVVGALHAIDLEPDKMAIRTPSGMDWSCEYPPRLESEVLGLIGRRVWAKGVGRVTSTKAGVLELRAIHALPEAEQTRLFTGPPVPLDTLKETQGITTPQGINAFADPDWQDDEESGSFLRALLGEHA